MRDNLTPPEKQTPTNIFHLLETILSLLMKEIEWHRVRSASYMTIACALCIYSPGLDPSRSQNWFFYTNYWFIKILQIHGTHWNTKKVCTSSKLLSWNANAIKQHFSLVGLVEHRQHSKLLHMHWQMLVEWRWHTRKFWIILVFIYT